MLEHMMIDLFDRWERVWHDGQFDLAQGCMADLYICHDEDGDRTVTREAYTAEITTVRRNCPDIRVVVYDHAFNGDRAWFRFAFKWTDTQTGMTQSRAGMQSYRTFRGRLVETWLSLQAPGSDWGDSVAQQCWTNSVPLSSRPA